MFAILMFISLCFWLIFLMKYVLQYFQSRKHLPPGPIGLPFVGYLPFLGNEPYKDIANLGTKYGNVLTIQMGINNVVILNDWEAVKDGYQKDQLLGRPPTTFNFFRKSSFVDDTGAVWQEHRRFTMRALRELRFGDEGMETKVIEELDHLRTQIDAKNGRPFDLHTLLTKSVCNTNCQLVFGQRFDLNDPKRCLLDVMVDRVLDTFIQVGVLTQWPKSFSKFIVKMGLYGTENIGQPLSTISSFVYQQISEHKKMFNPDNKHNYIDVYLDENNKRRLKDPNTSFTDQKLYDNCRGLFGGGNPTIRTAMEYLLVFAGHYWEHQNKIHEEIDSVIGRDRSPVWADRQHMPFTQAFINESYRCKPTVSISLTRCALEDTSILGHFIPKGTHIMANIYGVHYDPEVWKHPNHFNPNRFLVNDGKQVVKTPALIPFTYGKRTCAGETIAQLQIFLFFTSLLQRYRIRGPVDMSNTCDDNSVHSLSTKDANSLCFEIRD